jgi:hypothetical protein
MITVKCSCGPELQGNVMLTYLRRFLAGGFQVGCMPI